MLAYFKTGAGMGNGGVPFSVKRVLSDSGSAENLLLPCIKQTYYMKINTRTFKDKFVPRYSNAFILRKPKVVMCT